MTIGINALERLEKAVHAGNIEAVVPEDLEIEAHNTLWNETDAGQLTLLKLLPSVPATSIKHEYTRITSYGDSRGTGFFGERSLPRETNFESKRVVNLIKLMGEIGPTFLLASLETTQRALGTTGAQNIERIALRRNVLLKKCRNLYFSDTRSVKDGIEGDRFKGLLQLIEEGTNGTDGTRSPYGEHVVDMGGDPLTVETLRDRVAKSLTLFGRFTSLMMDPFVRADLEGTMDSAQRLPLPINAKPYLMGQHVGGIQTQGGVTFFETDNTLTPIHARGQYDDSIVEDMPTTTPVVSVAVGAPASDETSKWDAASAGDVYWVVTETVEDRESRGTRIPAATSTFTTVAAGQKATLTITPGTIQADSFKVYRGTDADEDDPTGAWFIYEVANTGNGGAVTWADLNHDRPNTSVAFGLNIKSKSQRAIGGGLVSAYENARENSAEFLKQPDQAGNTVAVAELGPSMGIMPLASVLAQVDRPLVYSACCPEIRNARQNIVFKNIGTLN